MEFFEPPLRITMPHPPTQSSFFLMPPPPFKIDIIIIKPDLHIFCSVQYDLYFLFNVKLLTTHSTDVAATSVNSKNKFCPFAKALLHYFSNIKKYRESKERKVNFRSSVYGSSRACRCWPLNFFLVIDKGKDDIFTPRVDGIIVVLIIIIAFTSAVLIFIAVTIFCNQKRLPTKMQTAARKEHVNFSSQVISLSPVTAGD